MRVRWMLFWLLFGLLLEFISHQCISVINTLADHHHRGTDFGGSPWLGIIIEFPRSYKVVITLWTVYLWVSFLKTIFCSRNGHDGSTDVQQRAWRSNRRRQEGMALLESP
nr:putative nuclear pore complex-interacting protein family member B2 [Pan troglodytes]